MGDGSLEKMFEMMFLGRGWEEKKIEAVGKRSSYQNEFFSFALAYRGAALSGVARRNGLWPGSVRP